MKLSIEKMHEQGRPDSVNLSNSNGDWVAECGAWTNREAQANAAEIVRRVNTSSKLARLVREAFDRFTDNDMQPPNHKLATWLGNAITALAELDEDDTLDSKTPAETEREALRKRTK